jgi:hypothetical protein
MGLGLMVSKHRADSCIFLYCYNMVSTRCLFQHRCTMKFELIDEWKSFWRMYSVWAFVILGVTPDLYNLAVQYHMVDGGNAPAALAGMINTLAFAGAALRLVKQKKLEADVAKLTEDANKK